MECPIGALLFSMRCQTLHVRRLNGRPLQCRFIAVGVACMADGLPLAGTSVLWLDDLHYDENNLFLPAMR